MNAIERARALEGMNLAFALGDLTLAGVQSVRNALDALRSARGRAVAPK